MGIPFIADRRFELERLLGDLNRYSPDCNSLTGMNFCVLSFACRVSNPRHDREGELTPGNTK